MKRWFDTARALKAAREDAARVGRENVRLHSLLRARGAELASVRRENLRLSQREPVTVDTLALGHRAEQAEAQLVDLQERHETALRLLTAYSNRFGDITQEAQA